MVSGSKVCYSFSMGKGLFLFSCILYVNMSYIHIHIFFVFIQMLAYYIVYVFFETLYWSLDT